jgi:sialic acid synthase SpsE/RimJ/RimL family protein N-acetyltransferase
MSEKESVGFECVQPIKDHARLIMQWRNDPLSLEMSYHIEHKQIDSFYNEFLADYFSMQDLPPLFIIHEGKRVGFLRFRPAGHPTDPYRRVCEISINIAPEFRNRGLGKHALIEIKEWVKAQGYDDIYAEVKEKNKNSQKLFLSAGYKQIKSIHKTISDTGKTFSVCCYLAPLTEEKKGAGRVFVVAEAGSNWRMGTAKRDRDMAKALVDVAVDAGADAVKFQTYRPETLYVHNAGQSGYLMDLGITEDIFTLFADLAMPYELVEEIAAYCKGQGIQFMSTAFSEKDFEAVDPHVSIHKIASYEISHIHLLRLAARSGKPLVLSTGASEEGDIAWAVEAFRKNGGKDLTLLQCTSKYPADPASMNLQVIPWLKRRFKVDVGLSDHSRDPIVAPVSAVALGATLIEKHFTLSNALPGPDHSFAVLPHELKQMVEAIRVAEKMRGSGLKKIDPCEEELRAYARRGVQALRKIGKGEPFHEGKNIAVLRPGNQRAGVHPMFLPDLEGKSAKREISAGSGIEQGDW